MRLLNATTRQLAAFPDDQIPRYAILSHTWGTPGEEVSFQDLQGATTKLGVNPRSPSWMKKPGWAKIENACAQSLKHNCQYIWIDTCCIDKSSSAELQEGINSMFRWYESASICLAYLSDVSSDHDHEACDSSFRKARWFTRGWTLQELLAPMIVVFFDQDWNMFGTKESLSGAIEKFTGIDSRYICWDDPFSSTSTGNAYGCLSQASVAERMSWAARRHTTRKEDIAYCLLGIFDIHMPMLYGEGNRAFARLQEEIMKATDDSTLLSWGYKQPWDDRRETDDILALIPASFEHCRDLTPSKLNGFPRPSFSMTQKGLELTLPVRADESHKHIVYAILACGPRQSIDEPGCCKSLLAIPLVSTSACDDPSFWKEQNEYLRYTWCSPSLVSPTFLKAAKTRTIIIRRPSRVNGQLINLSIRLRAPRGYDLIGTYPPQPITPLLGTRFISLSKFSSGQVPSWIDPSNQPGANLLPSKYGHETTWHSEEGQRMFHIGTSVGILLVILEYKVAIAKIISGDSKEWSHCTSCRVFDMPFKEFQLELLHDLALTQNFVQLREIQAVGCWGEDTIFRINNEDKLLLVIRTQSLDDSFTKTKTNIAILTDEGILIGYPASQLYQGVNS
ncbi:HET-domain-containing protein [Acephala macrosclerotiorum]|nr:HET-domain-containing protein [Acephala macrosclerotiorum]